MDKDFTVDEWLKNDSEKNEINRDELKVAAEPLISYLRKHGNPMDTIIVTKDTAELLSSKVFANYI